MVGFTAAGRVCTDEPHAIEMGADGKTSPHPASSESLAAGTVRNRAGGPVIANSDNDRLRGHAVVVQNWNIC